MKQRELPVGICLTYFYNASYRKKVPKEARDPKERRPCYMAYAGEGDNYKTKRFPIDTLGEEQAFKMAVKWRKSRGPLDCRASDNTRKINNLRRKAAELVIKLNEKNDAKYQLAS